MIIPRKPLSLWERLYLPAIIGGFKVTLRHFFKKKVTLQYPEERWVVPPGLPRRALPGADQDGRTKCVSCQLCEFVCPPKAIRITPPGPAGPAGRPAQRREDAAGVRDQHAPLHLLRLLPGGLPRGGHLPDEGLFPDRHQPRRR